MKRISRQQFVEEHIATILTACYAGNAARTLRAFGSIVNPQGLHAVRQGTLEPYVATLQRNRAAASTINILLRHIGAAWSKAVRHG